MSWPCLSYFLVICSIKLITTQTYKPVHFLKTIKTPRFEYYDVQYLDDNPWAFLGNGRIRAEVELDLHKLTPYLRNEDRPWTIE